MNKAKIIIGRQPALAVFDNSSNNEGLLGVIYLRYHPSSGEECDITRELTQIVEEHFCCTVKDINLERRGSMLEQELVNLNESDYIDFTIDVSDNGEDEVRDIRVTGVTLY